MTENPRISRTVIVAVFVDAAVDVRIETGEFGMDGVILRGEEEFDGVGRGDLSGEVVEEGLAVGESDGGDPLGASALDVVGVLEVVVGDVIKESFEGIKIALLGPVGGFGVAGEAVV